MDIADYNRRAWDGLVEKGDRWTVPVSADQVAEARAGRWHIALTPNRAVPRDWFPPLVGAGTLCLAGAGGQQAPLLAAAGARVTVFDNSPRQLAQDRFVAGRDGLEIATIQPDELEALRERGEPMVFSHSLEEQIGGQLAAGLVLTALFEDVWTEKPLSSFTPAFLATRATKLR